MTPRGTFLLPLTGEKNSRMLLFPRRTERLCAVLLFGVLLAAVSASIPGKLSALSLQLTYGTCLHVYYLKTFRYLHKFVYCLKNFHFFTLMFKH